MKDEKTNRLFKNYKWRIAGLIGGNAVSNIPRGAFTGILFLIIMNISIPVIEKRDFDYDLLYRYFYMYAAAFLIYIVLTIISQRNNFIQSYTIGSDVRLRLGEKLRRLSLGFFKNNDPGDVTSRMLHDVNKAEEILSHNLPDIVSAVIVPVLLGSFLCFINLRLSVILFTAVAVSLFFFTAGRIIIRVLGKKHLEAVNRASSRILEYTRTIKPLKSFSMTGKSFSELDRAMIKLKKLSFISEVWTGIPVQIAMFILDAGYLAMLYYAVKYTLAGDIAVYELFTFTILGFYFFEPIKNAGVILVLLRHAANSTDRIKEIFSAQEPDYSSDCMPPDNHEIKFEDVSFRYKNENVLDGINFSASEKSMTALVGVSGSGKTTITSLISRFWDIQGGRIKIGDTDIRNINPDLLLKDISMVFQDVYLFNDTIANNIKIGRKDATDEEVEKAARLACCHDFISSLPEGYDTVVSEGGKTLSGGERQRISIARAVLKDAPVVLLDEATASLDPENENEIQKAITNLVKNKTLIVIVHKFNSIQNADQILVLDRGKITQSGRHDELICKDGLYKKLWKAQQQAGSWKMRSA